MNLLDLMALTPVAPDPELRFLFGTDEPMVRAYRAAIYHWEGQAEQVGLAYLEARA